MRFKAAQFVSLVFVMLVTGVFWGSWLGLSRSIQTFTPETYLAIGHAMIANLAPVMPVLVIIAVLSQLVLLYQLRSRGFSAILPSLIAFLMFLIAVAVTLLVEVPIDKLDSNMDSDVAALRLDDDSRPLGSVSRPSDIHRTRRPDRFDGGNDIRCAPQRPARMTRRWYA